MSFGVTVQNPKARSRLAVDRGGAQGNVGAALLMRLQQLSVIHAVELIAAQDQVVLKRALQKVVEVLAHGVSRALQFGHLQGCHGIAVGQYGASGGGGLNHGWVADNVGRGALGEGFSFNLLTEQRYQILAGGTPSAKAPLR